MCRRLASRRTLQAFTASSHRWRPRPTPHRRLQRAGADVERRAGGVDVVDEQRRARRRRGDDGREPPGAPPRAPPRPDLPPPPVRAPQARSERQPGPRGEPGREEGGGVEPPAPEAAPVRRDRNDPEAALPCGRMPPAGTLRRRRGGRAGGWRPGARPSGPRRERAAELQGADEVARRPLVGQRRPRAVEGGGRRRAARPVARERAARAAVAAEPGHPAEAGAAHQPLRSGARHAAQKVAPADHTGAARGRARGPMGSMRGIGTSISPLVQRNSTRTSQSCAVSLDTSWTFAPGVLIALAGYAVDLRPALADEPARGRRARRRRRGAPSRGPAASRACSWRSSRRSTCSASRWRASTWSSTC